MPVDLDTLPERLVPPSAPDKRRWLLVILLCCLLGGSLGVLFWPSDSWRMSGWFWCCVLVLPSVAGLLLFALRTRAYEQAREYAQSWNRQHTEHERLLIAHGQRAIALLATSYRTPAGNNQLARALRSSSTRLQPVYLSDVDSTLRASQLMPLGDGTAVHSYQRRLQLFLQQLMCGLNGELQRYGRSAPLNLRIKHNGVLSDAEVLSVWRSCAAEDLAIDQVRFATQDDGVLWLDEWLDQPEACSLLLSLEINVFQEPVSEQAESVSALLLAQSQFCEMQNLTPEAWIHRPVPMTNEAKSLQDVLRWGRIGDNEPCFVWQAQIPGDVLCAVSIAMERAGRSLDIDKCMRLDDAFGRPASALGNITIIVASEQAAADVQPQLVMLQDASPQWCVIRPAVQTGSEIKS
ncbi:hypothetical protein [Pseudomonas sp. NPDC087029]|uniref:hypothetical protein n=1 Tax=Pseudomonas sp. NPDC087029 TaxID=3364433 RepID=UPI0037F47A75